MGKNAPNAPCACPWVPGPQGEGGEPQSVVCAGGNCFLSCCRKSLTSPEPGSANSLGCPSSGNKCQALFPSSHWATGPTLQSASAHSLCRTLQWPGKEVPGKASSLDLGAHRGSPAQVPRSAFQSLFPKLGLPWLLLPSFVWENPQGTHLGFFGRRVVSRLP